MSWTLIFNSLFVSAAAMAVSLVIGFCAAVWARGLSSRWRNRILFAAVLTLALPPFLVTGSWIRLLGNAGIIKPWLPLSIYSLWGTVWILSLLHWPISFLLVSGALSRVEPSQWESDPELRAWPLIRWILWPAAQPLIRLAGLLTFVLAMNNFAVPAILQTKVFAAEIWVSFNTTFNYAEALVLSLPLLAAPILLFLAFPNRSDFAWPASSREGNSPASFRRQLGGKWFHTMGALTIATLLLALGLPISLLGGEARTWTELWPAFAAGKSALANSFVFAFLTSTLCATLSVVAWKRRWGAAFWLPFLVPGILLGIAIIRIFNQPSLAALYQSYGIVIFAFALRFWAVSWSATRRAMQSVDPDLADDARLNGASGLRLFLYVHARQIAPQAAAAWYIIYVLCLWDIETILLIVPPGAETVAMRIFNLLHYGYNPQVNALCLLLLVLAVLPLLLGRLARFVPARRLASSLFHAVPSALALLTFACGMAAGCGKPQSNGTPIDSDLFSGVEVIGSRGTGAGQFNKPRSVAVDSSDNLYAVDMTGRVQKFSPNGEYRGSLQMERTDLGKPKGMCADLSGNIIVIEPHYSRVNHISPALELVSHWGAKGTNVGEFTLPRAAAVNSAGEIWVSEYSMKERVQRFTKDGSRSTLSLGVRGSHEGQFNRPEGLGLDRADRLYVADSCNHRIQVFGPDGTFLRAFGTPGSEPGEFSYPYDIRIDSDGIQFVCEFGNSRIQIFDESGKVLEILGKAGAAPGEFNNPWSIALDSRGNLYVADSRNHRVQKFIRKGKPGPS